MLPGLERFPAFGQIERRTLSLHHSVVGPVTLALLPCVGRGAGRGRLPDARLDLLLADGRQCRVSRLLAFPVELVELPQHVAALGVGGRHADRERDGSYVQQEVIDLT